jgi:hypothetical protein
MGDKKKNLHKYFNYNPHRDIKSPMNLFFMQSGEEAGEAWVIHIMKMF